MLPHLKVNIICFTLVAANTIEMQLKVPRNFNFVAGQYVSITIPSLAELPDTQGFHDFSIASSPIEKGLIRIVFRKSDSTFKKALLKLAPGSQLYLEGPSGIFTLPSNQAVICVAGGIGITPFLSMVTDSQTAFELMYYNQSPQTAINLASLEKLLGPKLHSYFGEPELEQLQTIHLKNPLSPWYVAGPPKMVDHTRALLKRFLVDDKMIRTEEFSGYDKLT